MSKATYTKFSLIFPFQLRFPLNRPFCYTNMSGKSIFNNYKIVLTVQENLMRKQRCLNSYFSFSTKTWHCVKVRPGAGTSGP